MPQLLPNCPLCASTELSIFNPVNYTECKNCKIVFQNPMPNDEELTKLYQNYYAYIDKEANIGYKDYEENRSPEIFTKNYVSWIEKFLKDKSGTLLDFGCGTGNFNLALRGAGYKLSEGCEFAPDAFEPLQKKGVACFECKNLASRDKKYSAITMIDVIEHLREPKKDLKAIHVALAENGLLFIETINIDDFFVKIFHKEKWIGIAPGHTYLWGENSLRNALTKNGFKILETRKYKISGSFVKWMIVGFLSLFSKKFEKKYKEILFQFSLGDGVRVTAQKVA